MPFGTSIERDRFRDIIIFCLCKENISDIEKVYQKSPAWDCLHEHNPHAGLFLMHTRYSS